MQIRSEGETMEKITEQIINHSMESAKNQNTTDLLDLQRNEGRQSTKMQYTNTKCKHGLCDGTGVIYGLDENGLMAGRNCECTKDRIKEGRLQFAKIPEEFINLTINSFRTDYETEEAQAIAARARTACARYVKEYEHFEEVGKGLYFYSDTKGSGKTRLAISVGNALMNYKNKGVRYITTLDLLGEIRKTFDRDSETTETEVIDAVNTVDCLILDDVGVEDGEKPWIKEKMFQILDYRMTRKKITIFTSNVPVEKLKHDDRIKNRIERMATPIVMPEESIRSQLSAKENEDVSRILFG